MRSSGRSPPNSRGRPSTSGAASHTTHSASQILVRLTALSTDDLKYYESKFFLVPGTGSVYVNATMSVIRQRDVGGGFRERLT